jgi:hypothetical protein
MCFANPRTSRPNTANRYTSMPRAALNNLDGGDLSEFSASMLIFRTGYSYNYQILRDMIAKPNNPLLSDCYFFKENQLNSLDSQSFSSGLSSNAAAINNSSFEQLLLSSSIGGCYTLHYHFYHSCSHSVMNKTRRNHPLPLNAVTSARSKTSTRQKTSLGTVHQDRIHRIQR